MITLIIFFVSLASTSFVLLQWRVAAIIAATATLLLFLAVGSGLIPSLLIKPLQSKAALNQEPAWGERNMTSIVEPSVLAYSRIVEATRPKITGFLFILGAVFFQKNSAKLQENHHAWMNVFQIHGSRYKSRKTRYGYLA
jgi:hypothetical protein